MAYLFNVFMLSVLFFSVQLSVANAADTPKPVLTLEQKTDKARVDSQLLEQAQLEKARQASKDAAERADKIKQKSQTNDWATQQKRKAQQQSVERETREQKYLREAKEAATQEHKIPKP
ncbi:hypothetical protein [Shewanella morhuae]|nr:hypothetical protein [Shewanella morhuae]